MVIPMRIVHFVIIEKTTRAGPFLVKNVKKIIVFILIMCLVIGVVMAKYIDLTTIIHS